MKIRQGFVSNSSSSSFCILGVRLKNLEFDMIDIAEKLNLVDMEDKETDDHWEDECNEAFMDSHYVLDTEVEHNYTVAGVMKDAYDGNGSLNVTKTFEDVIKLVEILKLDDINEEDVNIYFG